MYASGGWIREQRTITLKDTQLAKETKDQTGKDFLFFVSFSSLINSNY
jgi:hypothetical protein